MRLSPAAGLYAIVLAVLAVELLLPAELLEYRRALAAQDPWRLLTGHFVQLSFVHAALNVVALLLLDRLFADRLRPREFFAILGIAPIAMSLVFWLVLPELQWYRGLSGALLGHSHMDRWRGLLRDMDGVAHLDCRGICHRHGCRYVYRAALLAKPSGDKTI